MAIGVMTLDEMSELRSASVMMWICHIDDFICYTVVVGINIETKFRQIF